LLTDKVIAIAHQIIITEDGSHTIFVPVLNETYHSTHGAIDESKCVFFENGLKHFSNCDEVNILEVGFGTGLNAFLAFLYSVNESIKISYTSIEKFPLSQSIVEGLNYPSSLFAIDHQDLFIQMHLLEDSKRLEVSDTFSFEKRLIDIKNFTTIHRFDLIFFDAFSPDKTPELWTKETLQKMFELLRPKGVLSTYCAKGAVKRTLKEIGFRLEHPRGPKGKREITTAFKNEEPS